MMNFRTLTRFNREEGGSAMTEFVMGLPIYIMIFVGLGGLYRLNQDKLEAYAATSASLWSRADTGAGQIVPALAATNVNSGIGALQNGISTFGIYGDSGVKALPGILAGGVNRSCFTASCALDIQATGDSFSRTLLDDNFVTGLQNINGSGWANILSSLLNVSGTRPSFAAGIRYGAVEGDSISRSGSVAGISYNHDPGILDLPGITQPSHRSIAVILTRLEFSTQEPWSEQILVFNNDFDFDSTDAAEGAECQEAGQAFQDCADLNPDNPSACEAAQENTADQCGDIGGSDPFGEFSWGNAGID